MKMIDKITKVEAYLDTIKLSLDNFYCVTMWPDKIGLQANFNSNIVAAAGSGKFTTTEAGYLQAYYAIEDGIYIEITLT